MKRQKLRDAIAVEAARLILRRKETDYAAARKRAARWLSRRRLAPADLPSQAEIEMQIRALSGLFSEEHQTALRRIMLQTASELMTQLTRFTPLLTGAAIDGSLQIGAELTVELSADSVDEVIETLAEIGITRHPHRSTPQSGVPSELWFHYRVPCSIAVYPTGDPGPLTDTARMDLTELRLLLEHSDVEKADDRELFDGELADDAELAEQRRQDAFALFAMLLSRLEEVALDPVKHPEGDALYHSLQVFQLGLEERSYDEEFLLACLLHDAGKAIDRKHPVEAAVAVLQDVISPRTSYLIENVRLAVDYLRSGRISRSVRFGEHFEDLLLLARCDLAGRVPGMQVPELEEALEFIAGLESAWDE